jgi:hypothetical protein
LIGKATKDLAQAGTYHGFDLRKLISQIDRFTLLSEDETVFMKETALFLAEKKFPLEKIHKTLLSLRPEEAGVAKKMFSRFKLSITPTELKQEGVFLPLMSGYPSGKDVLHIYLPDDLTPYADHGLVLELLRFRGSVDRVEIQRTKGDINIQEEERLSSLIMGYISELLSNQKIAKISYTRASYYQLGRMLARAKLLEFVATDLKIPMKYVQIPSRFLGGTTDFQEPESIRTLKSLISGDVELINTLLKHLAAHTYKVQADQVKKKIDSNLFTSFPEFVHMFERRARVENKKGKSGKVKTSYTTIKATKPSTLSTVAPWEKDACQELYDSPWKEMSDLEELFTKTPTLERDYFQMAKTVTRIINEQWSAKQTLLRKTNHRLAVSGLSDSTPLWQRLNRVRSFLAEQKSIDTCDAETLLRIVKAYDILPSGLVTLKDGFNTSWEFAFKRGDLAERYPATTRLIKSYMDNTRPVKSDVISG